MLTLGKGQVFKQIVEDFSAAGYTVYHKLVNAADYGVPQLRERVILVGVRGDLDFVYQFPEPTHGHGVEGLPEWSSLRDAIFDLKDAPGPYYEGSCSSIYMSRNRKKSWDEPSFTSQASGRQAPMHPSGGSMVKTGKDKYEFTGDINRRLSVMEAARIQTFPDWYTFYGGPEEKSDARRLDCIYKQVGNAVPVRLAYAIAMPIAEYVISDITESRESHHEAARLRNMEEQEAYHE
jgi:DNA (cytosine-5)-methyltransferase 1